MNKKVDVEGGGVYKIRAGDEEIIRNIKDRKGKDVKI